MNSKFLVNVLYMKKVLFSIILSHSTLQSVNFYL